MMDSLSLLLAQALGLLAALNEARPEMVERLGETTVQKIDAAARDVQTIADEIKNNGRQLGLDTEAFTARSSAGPAIDPMGDVPPLGELIAMVKGMVDKRMELDAAHTKVAERTAAALEALAEGLKSEVFPFPPPVTVGKADNPTLSAVIAEG